MGWLLIPGIGLVVLLPFVNTFQDKQAGPQDLPLLLFLLILAIAVMVCSFYIPIKMYKHKENDKLEDAKRNYPNFKIFYKEWKGNRRKEMWGIIGMVAIGIVLVGLSESHENSVQRDIHQIKNRIKRL